MHSAKGIRQTPVSLADLALVAPAGAASQHIFEYLKRRDRPGEAPITAAMSR